MPGIDLKPVIVAIEKWSVDLNPLFIELAEGGLISKPNPIPI